QPQVADDFLAEQAVDVGRRGDLEAGEDFLGHARAADDGPAFEDEHPPAGAGQVAGGDQAVVAGADDDRVVGGCHESSPGRGAPCPPLDSAPPSPRRGEGNKPGGAVRAIVGTPPGRPYTDRMTPPDAAGPPGDETVPGQLVAFVAFD